MFNRLIADCASDIVEIFEELLEEKNMVIPCANEYEELERENDDGSSVIYGSEYGDLIGRIRERLEDFKEDLV